MHRLAQVIGEKDNTMKLTNEKCAEIIYRVAKRTPKTGVALSKEDTMSIYGDYMTLVFLTIYAAQAINDSKDADEASKRVMNAVIDYMEHDISSEVTDAFDSALKSMSDEDLEILGKVLGGDMKDYVARIDDMRNSPVARFKKELLPDLLDDIFEG